MVGSVVGIGALTCCAELHSMCDLKATQMNVQCNLIRELMLYEFDLTHNTAKATKNICAKSEGTVYHSAVIRWFKKFCLGCKNLNNQARSGRPKTMNSKDVIEAIEAYLDSIR